MPNNPGLHQAVGILGFGEVGKAIAKFYKQPKIKDIDHDDGLAGVDVLHICIPGNAKFVANASKEIKAIKPKLVIIHSTVTLGTTKELTKQFPKIPIVHSPIRGVHPHLHKGVKTFVKFIGAQNKKTALTAQKHLQGLGIKTKIVIPAATTELAKLVDTTYYGLAIAFHGEVKKWCDQLGVDFETVMTEFNKTYNEGYAKLGKTNVIRPVLKAPQGGIGGHCVISNAKILKQFFASPALDLILEYEPAKTKTGSDSQRSGNVRKKSAGSRKR